MKLLKVPYYRNSGDGNRCLQVACKCVIEYFTNKKVSLEKLDKLTRRKTGYWTWTSQLVPVLMEYGLDVNYYSNEDLKPYLQGKGFIKKHFGKHSEQILKYTDLPVLINSINKTLKYDVFRKKKITIKDIEKFITKGFVSMVMIDWNKIANLKGLYQGHFVVITGYDDKNIYYHESGPGDEEPNKKISKLIFARAMNAIGTDNDCIVVYGKKQFAS